MEQTDTFFDVQKMASGVFPPQPTRDLGSVVSSPIAGAGAERQLKTIVVVF